MNDKTILGVEIDTSAFDSFQKKYKEFEASIATLPGEWSKASTHIKAQKSDFEKLAQMLQSAKKPPASPFASIDDVPWISIGTGSKHILENITKGTLSLSKWIGLSSVFGAILSGGGLYGLNKLAADMSGRRRSASDVGATPGEVANFETQFSRLGIGSGYLAQVNEWQRDSTQRSVLYGIGGKQGGDKLLSESTTDAAADLLPMIKKLASQHFKDPKQIDSMAKAYGLDPTLVRTIMAMPQGELDALVKQFHSSTKAFELTPDVLTKWSNLQRTFQEAGGEIEVAFINKLPALRDDVGKVAVDLGKIIDSTIREGSEVDKFIKGPLKTGIEAFTGAMESGGFRTTTEEFLRNADAAVKLLDKLPWATIGRMGAEWYVGGLPGVVVGEAARAAVGLLNQAPIGDGKNGTPQHPGASYYPQGETSHQKQVRESKEAATPKTDTPAPKTNTPAPKTNTPAPKTNTPSPTTPSGEPKAKDATPGVEKPANVPAPAVENKPAQQAPFNTPAGPRGPTSARPAAPDAPIAQEPQAKPPAPGVAKPANVPDIHAAPPPSGSFTPMPPGMSNVPTAREAPKGTGSGMPTSFNGNLIEGDSNFHHNPAMGRPNYLKGQPIDLVKWETAGGIKVTSDRQAAPHMKMFLEDLEAAGAPLKQSGVAAYVNRRQASGSESMHSHGGAIDVMSTGRDALTPEMQRWVNTHQKELESAELHSGMLSGRHFSKPDMGHWEWGGGEGVKPPEGKIAMPPPHDDDGGFAKGGHSGPSGVTPHDDKPSWFHPQLQGGGGKVHVHDETDGGVQLKTDTVHSGALTNPTGSPKMAQAQLVNVKGNFNKDFGAYAKAVAGIESHGGKDADRSGSKFHGKYQMGPGYGGKGNEETRFRRGTEANAAQLRKSLGREPTNTELYVAHQQGASSAGKMAAHPDKSPHELGIKDKSIRANHGDPNKPSKAFINKWAPRMHDNDVGGPGPSPLPIAT